MLIFTGCNETITSGARKVERSMYHWKTTLKITANELRLMDSLEIRTLYVKFFDVDYDQNLQKPLPVGMLRTEERNLQLLRDSGHQTVKFHIIPTIFITERCMRNIDTADITSLVNNIY